MARFLIRRLLNMIPLILGITFLSFLAMSLVPGNFLSNLKLNPRISPAGHQADGGAVRPRSAAAGPLRQVAVGRAASEPRLLAAYRVSVTGAHRLARVQHDHPVGGQHAVCVGDRDSDRNHRRGESEFDLGSLAFVPRVLRDVGAELLSRLPDDVLRAEDRMVSDRRHLLGRLRDARLAERRSPTASTISSCRCSCSASPGWRG